MNLDAPSALALQEPDGRFACFNQSHFGKRKVECLAQRSCENEAIRGCSECGGVTLGGDNAKTHIALPRVRSVIWLFIVHCLCPNAHWRGTTHASVHPAR